MAEKLTDKIVDALFTPETGNKIYWDGEVKGFGCRVTAAGARSFILNYRNSGGRERRFTIGSRPEWKTIAAREEAKELKVRVDRGEDPLGDREADRQTPTVADLCARYAEEHLPGKRAAAAADDRAMVRDYILPKLKHVKVADAAFADIDGLHRSITKDGKPYRANRAVALLSKMFSLAVLWQWRADHRNPCKGVKRNHEDRRKRYLSIDELARLTDALAAHEDKQAADIIRLLLLTGARKTEVTAARWDQFDLTDGKWKKPASTTKQKKDHEVPLSAPARQLLSELRAQVELEAAKNGATISEYVFPGRSRAGYRKELKKDWRALCLAAGLVDTATVTDARGRAKTIRTPNARIHDLRHTYASVLVNAGLSLPVIGELLGHSRPETTARYAHLANSSLRQATERAGAIIMPSRESAEVVPIKGGAA